MSDDNGARYIFVKGTDPLHDMGFQVTSRSKVDKVLMAYTRRMQGNMSPQTCIRFMFGTRILHSNDNDGSTIESIGIQGIPDFAIDQTTFDSLTACIIDAIVQASDSPASPRPTKLDLSHRKIAASIPAILKCQYLQTLNLSGCVFDNVAYHELVSIGSPKLTDLNLSNIRLPGDEGLGSLIAACTGLTRLNVSRCYEPNACIMKTDRTILPSLVNCVRLTALDLGGCGFIVDDDLVELTNIFHMQILELRLSGCSISDDGLSNLAFGRIGPVAILDVSWCLSITNVGLASMAAGFGSITKLNISGCFLIDNDGLVLLARRCPEMIDLKIEGCNAITEKGLQILAILGLATGCRIAM